MRSADARTSGHCAGHWHRGGRLPASYRDRQYVVNDWHGHHLHAPPHGYQWVQVGNDYVLAAIATGIIAQQLAGMKKRRLGAAFFAVDGAQRSCTPYECNECGVP